MALPKIVLASTTPALTVNFTADELKPGQVSKFTDFSQGIVTLRDSVTFSVSSTSKSMSRTEVRIPYSVTGVDALGAPILKSRSYTRITRDVANSLDTASRTAEFERIASLFDKVKNPDFYQAWINVSPMLGS